MNKSLGILLVDDHDFLRQGLRVFFGRQPGCTVVGEARSAEEALEFLLRSGADLVVMDVGLPGEDGVAATRMIKARWPQTKVLVLSGQPSRPGGTGDVQRALLAGADGFVSKQDGEASFGPALQAVRAGRSFLSPDAATELVAVLRAEAAQSARTGPVLSEREHAVLTRLSEGASYKDIGADLGLSVKSVETFRTRGMRKLGLTTREELVRYARHPGLPRPPAA